MNFIDVGFKTKAVGTINDYCCQTELYGIDNNLEEINIVTWIENTDDTIKEVYNPNITITDLLDIELLLQEKNIDIHFKKMIKRKMIDEKNK